jgi:hypothetical protein
MGYGQKQVDETTYDVPLVETPVAKPRAQDPSRSPSKEKKKKKTDPEVVSIDLTSPPQSRRRSRSRPTKRTLEFPASRESSPAAQQTEDPEDPIEEFSAPVEDKQYVVEDIIGKKDDNGVVKYLIKWRGYDEPTWEPLANLDHCDQLIKRWEEQHKKYA